MTFLYILKTPTRVRMSSWSAFSIHADISSTRCFLQTWIYTNWNTSRYQNEWSYFTAKNGHRTVLHQVKVKTAKLNFDSSDLSNQCDCQWLDNVWIFTRLIWVFKTSTWEEKRVITCKIALGWQPIACSWTPCLSHTQYFQLQAGIPWNKDIMRKIVQPCYFITGHFSQPERKNALQQD